MSSKNALFAILVLAFALVGCAGRPLGPWNPAPGGPIIVIEPNPETKVNLACKEWPCWRIDCPFGSSANGLPALAADTETLTGVPWRLGDSVGAEMMLVTLVTPDPKRPENPIDASMIELELDSTRSLKIELVGKDKVPTWSLESGDDTNPLKRRFLVFLPNWPHAAFGQITGVKVTYRSDPKITIPVELTNLKLIQVFYNREDSDKYCE